jgi:hypothetical protein
MKIIGCKCAKCTRVYIENYKWNVHGSAVSVHNMVRWGIVCHCSFLVIYILAWCQMYLSF